MEIGGVLFVGIIAVLVTYCLYLKTKLDNIEYRMEAIEHLIDIIEEDNKNLE